MLAELMGALAVARGEPVEAVRGMQTDDHYGQDRDASIPHRADGAVTTETGVRWRELPWFGMTMREEFNGAHASKACPLCLYFARSAPSPVRS